MTIEIKHQFVSGKADSADTTLVNPSDWNNTHNISMATARLIGRTTAGAGSAQEISVSSDMSLTGGVLGLSSGNSSKLASVEQGADVTDATNVAAAGAVMDGDFSVNGLMTRTAAGTYSSRTITGTANQITVTNGNGGSGNPTISIPTNGMGYGVRTVSTSDPTGGSNGDVWFKV